MSLPSPRIRLAVESDVEDLAALARLANEHDGMHRVTEGLAERLFANAGCCRALVADLDGPVVGVAHFHVVRSTLAERPALWLDDLFVVEDYRGNGIGEALLVELARICREENCSSIDFTTSRLRAPAIRFYRRLGAIFFAETFYGRLTAADLKTARARQRIRQRAARKRQALQSQAQARADEPGL